MRLRSGADKKGHEECQNEDFRHHLALCDRYRKNRPELNTIYEDKHLDKWKKWWESNEYLNMGIPTNTKSHENVRVIFGNPFDNTITTEKNGRIITEKVNSGPCERCGIVHLGRCNLLQSIARFPEGDPAIL